MVNTFMRYSSASLERNRDCPKCVYLSTKGYFKTLSLHNDALCGRWYFKQIIKVEGSCCLSPPDSSSGVEQKYYAN